MTVSGNPPVSSESTQVGDTVNAGALDWPRGETNPDEQRWLLDLTIGAKDAERVR